MLLRRTCSQTCRWLKPRSFSARSGLSEQSYPVLPFTFIERPWVQWLKPHLGSGAYVVLAGGFMFSDVLWMRLVLTGGYLALGSYHAIQHRPLYIPLLGSLIFAIINLWKAEAVYKDRHVVLSDDEQLIYSVFQGALSPGEFRKLYCIGQAVTMHEPKVIVQKGQPADLILVREGTATVHLGSFKVEVHKDQLIGVASWLTNAATATVTAVPGSTYIIWRKADLQRLVDQAPHMETALAQVFLQHLSSKVKACNSQLVRRAERVALH